MQISQNRFKNDLMLSQGEQTVHNFFILTVWFYSTSQSTLSPKFLSKITFFIIKNMYNKANLLFTPFGPSQLSRGPRRIQTF